MTAKMVAGNPGSYRRQPCITQLGMTSTAGGPRTMQSAVTEAMQQAVEHAVPQALTDDDSAGQG